MKFWVPVLWIILLSATAEYFLPWWGMAIACFLVSLFVKQGKGRAFLMGFSGAGIFWLITSAYKDMLNEHILSAKMATLFHLPAYWLFILITTVVGALIGGLASLSGALVKPKN